MARSQYVYIWWGCGGDSDSDMLGVWTVKHEALNPRLLPLLGENAQLTRYSDGIRKGDAVTVAVLRDGVLTDGPYPKRAPAAGGGR